MRRDAPPTIVCLGDEDRARGHQGAAEQMYYNGLRHELFSDGSVALVGADERTVYIESPMLSEFAVLAPRDAGTEFGLYYVDIHGYNHRKDAMLPKGRQLSFGAYPELGYPTVVGPELFHFGDGIALMLSTALPESAPLIRSPISFIVSFSIMSPVEDLQSAEAGKGTVQGFLSTQAGFQGEESFFAQGDNVYSASTYGVDRTTEFPTYRAILGVLYAGSNSVETQTYDNGNGEVRFKQVAALDLIATASKNGVVAPAAYAFADDIIDYTSSGTLISSPFPIVVPLGNNRTITIGRRRNVDNSLIFGGTFSIVAQARVGTSLSTAAVPVTGIITGYFGNNAWSCGPVTQSSWTTPDDFVRSFYLFESWARGQRDCVPINQDETLVFGLRELLDSSPDWRAAWSCFSFSTSGVVVKSNVSVHYGAFSSNAYYRKDMDYVGATHDGGTGVYVFFHETFSPIGDNLFYRRGLVRYYSADNGATWDAGTDVTLDYGEGTPYAYWLSPPKWISTDAVSGEVKIIMAYTEGESVVGGTKLTKTTIQSSVDGGLTFTASPVADPNLNYTLPSGAWMYHTPRGQTSVQEFGNHEEGYAPSPFRHLPTYYGTPTKASRDTSLDPNL